MHRPDYVDERFGSHVGYRDVLGSMHANDARWTPTMAGLVVLRLVDKWVGALHGWLAPGPSEVQEVRKAIAKVSGPIQNALTAIVDAVTQSWGRRKEQVSARVLDYAALLADSSEWALAAGVYRTFLGFVADDEIELAAYAWYRLGLCDDWLNHLPDARQAHEAARDLARLVDDRYLELAAEHGIAHVVFRLGNLPEAAARLADVIAQCETDLPRRPALGIVRALALHDAGSVALDRGDTEQAFKLLHRAFDVAPEIRQQERILSDLALACMRVGLREAARDAYLVLEVTAVEETLRWIALLNLMHLATEMGSAVDFETHRRRLPTAKLPPRLAVDYYIYMAEESRREGWEPEAQVAFRRAMTLAERHRLNALLIEAEEKSKARTLPPVVPTPARATLGEATVRFIDKIEQMKGKLVGAGV